MAQSSAKITNIPKKKSYVRLNDPITRNPYRDIPRIDYEAMRDRGQLMTYGELEDALDHLFTRLTIRMYYGSKLSFLSGEPIEKVSTVIHFPVPACFTPGRRKTVKNACFLKNEVAEYVLFVEKLREDEILNRKKGHLVKQSKRVQKFVEEMTKRGAKRTITHDSNGGWKMPNIVYTPSSHERKRSNNDWF